MKEIYERSALLLGEDGMARLRAASVAVFGIGGVGGHAAEALARGGIGKITLIDKDEVSVSNINRQAVATTLTVGRKKVDVMRERIHEIDPDTEVMTHFMFYAEDVAEELDLSAFDYIIDAIDSVKSKLILIERAKALGVPIISSMGAGNKLDPTAFKVSDIKKTAVCPLAKVMRRELRLRGIDSLKVVYSEEEPIRAVAEGEKNRHAPASVSFVPPVVGLIIAGEVIKDIALKRL